jgi:hypothetical protein
VNSQEAKEILVFYRPGTADEHDPEFTEALALSKSDADLGRWLQEQTTVHQALRSRFQQIPVPPGLKEQILSERKAHIATATRLRRRAVLLATAMAGVFALLAVTSFYFRPHKGDSLAEFRGRMAEITLRAYPKMDLETNDLAQIRQFLANKQAPDDYVVPTALAKASGTGCAILKWRGHPVSMICFNSGKNTDPSEPSDLFLFVIDRTVVAGAPEAGAAQFTQLNRMGTVTWSAGDKTYVLGGYGNEAFIRQYF